MEGEEIVEKTENFKTFYTPVENRLLNVKKMYRTCWKTRLQSHFLSFWKRQPKTLLKRWKGIWIVICGKIRITEKKNLMRLIFSTGFFTVAVENYLSRIFLMISSTIALVWESFSISFSTFWMAYTMVAWSRPPNSSPMAFWLIWVISLTT